MTKTLLIIIILTIFSFSVFGQCEIESTPLEKINCEQREQFKKELEKIRETQRLFIPTLQNYLPKGENSWILGLVQHGGWDGKPKIKATITSDKACICNNNNNFTQNLLIAEKFDAISTLINKTSFAFLQPNYETDEIVADKNVSGNFGQLSIAETNLIIIRNESLINKKGKTDISLKTYRFKMRDFGDENSPINKISKLVVESANCSKDS